MSSPTQDFFEAEILARATRQRPPSEVLAQMRRAAHIEAGLRAGGRRLHFESPMDGPLEIELCGPEGPRERLSAGAAIALACEEG